MKLYRLGRHGGAEGERSVWYHGTTKKNLQSILSQGLIPNPKVRSWADDPEAGFNSPSRASLEGVYVTQNLLTATGAAMRGTDYQKGESRILVMMELQPRSLVADEDDISYSIKDALYYGNMNAPSGEYNVIDTYMARELGTNPEYITSTKEQYAEAAVARLIKMRFGNNIHPDFRKRLLYLLYKGWDIVLNRQVAYAYKNASEKSDYEWTRHFWRNISQETKSRTDARFKEIENSGKSTEEAYKQLMDEVCPKRPDTAKVEGDYAKTVDEITRLCKSMARPLKREDTFNQTGRALETIGFKGQNRITCILEIIPHVLYKETSEPYSERVKILYGTIPEDFVKQWEDRIGKLIVI